MQFRHCNSDLLLSCTHMSTLPFTIRTPKQSFSSVKALKSYKRDSSGKERISGLGLMNIDQTTSVNDNNVLDELSRKAKHIVKYHTVMSYLLFHDFLKF